MKQLVINIFRGGIVFCFLGHLNFSKAQGVENLMDFISAKNPDEVLTIKESANAYQEGDFRSGIKTIKRDMKKGGDFYDGFLFLAYGYKRIGNNKAAVDYINKAILMNAASPIGYFIRGNIYLDLKNYRLALSDYKSCIKKDTSFYQAYNNLALLRLYNQGGSGKIHNNDFKMAQRDLGSILSCEENKSKIEKIYFNLGLVHLNLNQYYEAICFFDKSAAMPAIAPKSIFYRGVAKFNIRMLYGAQSDFEQAKRDGYKMEECEKYLEIIELLNQP